jgi:hypothetical protein
MGFWDKSLRIFNCLCANTTQSVRRIAQQTGLSKSSVHRLTQAIERRNRHPESWFWETAAGRQWLTRLVVATLYTFGLKRGVGLDTMSEFFARLHLATQVGCSASALRGVMQTLETVLLETAATWGQDGQTPGEAREIIGAVDETFLERMLLVCMDLTTGYLLFEEVAEDRSYVTWKTFVDERLKALGISIRYLVSDRAKALIQLAEKGLECLSMPDFFHVVHELIKGYSLAIGQRLHQAHKQLEAAEHALARQLERTPVAPASSQAQAAVEASRTEVQRWEEVHSSYRHHLETLSLTLHPFTLPNSMPQTSAQVHHRLHAAIDAIDMLAQEQQLPTRHATLKKIRNQVPALAALVDFWWAGVEQDLEQAAISAPWRIWAKELLLPWVYWEHHVAHTRCARRKAQMRQACEAVRAVFHTHALTLRLPVHALEEWYTWATQQVHAFQRASSAVEGRNGVLAQLHHNQRGLPKRRYKVWTVLHNFDCRAADETTPASRFFKRAFPDLFETVLAHIEDVPRPRKRHQALAFTG